MAVVAKLWSADADKSRAGHVDPQCVALLRVLNDKRHLYTASSCAGRIIVTLNRTDDANTSYSVPWLFVSHDLVADSDAMLADVNRTLRDVPAAGTEVWLKLEPPIFAIVCSGYAPWVRVQSWRC